jgi:aminomethyltransferase
VLAGNAFPRPGYTVRAGGRDVATLTSGTVSPMSGEGIAMAYLPTDLSKPDTQVEVDVRGKPVAARVVRPPFYTGGSLRK